jgi:uncharacterized protein YjbI with pentapeptide repeats
MPSLKRRTIKRRTINRVKRRTGGRKSKRLQKKTKRVNSQRKMIEYPINPIGPDVSNTVVHGSLKKNEKLGGTSLQGTKFVDSTFLNVNFDGAGIDTRTEFINCTFKNVTWGKVNLIGVKFGECQFINVNFNGARMDKKTKFVECTFKNCQTDAIAYVKGTDITTFKAIFAQ